MRLTVALLAFRKLVYPLQGPGAVNITYGDFARLQPGEFLNDSLIEYGLKCGYLLHPDFEHC